ncbi:MAG: hypothetical protein AAF810_08870 [Cyanobacteria bacterium P01_D01_bin.36]
MSRLNLLESGQSYTFRSYFEMPHEPDEILSEFGVSIVSKGLSFPTSPVPIDLVTRIKEDLRANLEIVELTSETARREIMVAPVLTPVARLSKSRLRIEYSLTVSDQLKGKLDYFVEGAQSLLVVEAKNDDLARGFTQLGVELIALSQREQDQKILYGAVTIGDVWLFVWLDVETQKIYRDTGKYELPNDVEPVMSILMGILTNAGQPTVA